LELLLKDACIWNGIGMDEVWELIAIGKGLDTISSRDKKRWHMGQRRV
jgi:hypothetical protein